MLDAVKQLIFGESMRQPMLLVLEDLHSINPESQALIDGLVDGLSAARFMFLVSYRPEYKHSWSNKSYYTQVRIDPLTRAAAGEILHSLVGGGAGLEPLKQLVIRKTGVQSAVSRGERAIARRNRGPGRPAKGVSNREAGF